MRAAQRRRLKGAAVLCAVTLIGWLAFAVLEVSLQPVAIWTGWLLMAFMVALALFNLRKKLPFLPLGTAFGWMEFHSYAGIASIVLFFAHAGLDIPNGGLDRLLAGFFFAVAGSGLVGLGLTRALPVRLSTRGEVVLFERIPSLRRELHEEVETLVLSSAGDVGATTIADFYAARLDAFLRKPRHIIHHLLDSPRPYRALDREIAALERYAIDREQSVLSEIRERVRLKDDLDYQYAQQAVLKGWLFLHIPTTYGLLATSLLHAAVVTRFHGSLP
jgi:hypothetical protein